MEAVVERSGTDVWTTMTDFLVQYGETLEASLWMLARSYESSV